MDVKHKTNVLINYQVYSLHILNQLFGMLMGWFYSRSVFVIRVPACWWWLFGLLSWDKGYLFDVAVEWRKGVGVSLVGYFGGRVLYEVNSLM